MTAPPFTGGNTAKMKTENQEIGNSGISAENFIDKPEVARRLKKTIRSVDNWMKRGLLPYYKIGRSVLFKWSDVETHLKASCRVSRRGM